MPNTKKHIPLVTKPIALAPQISQAMQGMTQQSEGVPRPAMRQFQGTNGGSNMKDVFSWDSTTSNHKPRQQQGPPPPQQTQQPLTRPVRQTANKQSYNILAPESA